MIRIGPTLLTLVMLLIPLGAQAGPNIYLLRIDGLACPFCAYGIEKQLSTVKGVEKIDVDLKKGAVIVTMTEGTVLTETQAAEAVQDAGFTLRAFSLVPARE